MLGLPWSQQKGCQRLPDLPFDRSGYRKERDGLMENRHLHDLAESITIPP